MPTTGTHGNVDSAFSAGTSGSASVASKSVTDTAAGSSGMA